MTLYLWRLPLIRMVGDLWHSLLVVLVVSLVQLTPLVVSALLAGRILLVKWWHLLEIMR